MRHLPHRAKSILSFHVDRDNRTCARHSNRFLHFTRLRQTNEARGRNLADSTKKPRSWWVFFWKGGRKINRETAPKDFLLVFCWNVLRQQNSHVGTWTCSWGLDVLRWKLFSHKVFVYGVSHVLFGEHAMFYELAQARLQMFSAISTWRHSRPLFCILLLQKNIVSVSPETFLLFCLTLYLLITKQRFYNRPCAWKTCHVWPWISPQFARNPALWRLHSVPFEQKTTKSNRLLDGFRSEKVKNVVQGCSLRNSHLKVYLFGLWNCLHAIARMITQTSTWETVPKSISQADSTSFDLSKKNFFAKLHTHKYGIQGPQKTNQVRIRSYNETTTRDLVPRYFSSHYRTIRNLTLELWSGCQQAYWVKANWRDCLCNCVFSSGVVPNQLRVQI